MNTVESSSNPRVQPRVRDMVLVILLLLPLYGFAWYCHGIRVALMLAVSLAAGSIVEGAFSFFRKRRMSVSLLVTVFIYVLMLPPSIPLS